MPFIPDLSHRERVPELMDDPALDPRRHRRALDGLARVNRFSHAVASLVPSIRELAAANGHGPIRILDVACGGGDVAVGLARRLAAIGVDARVDGMDLSRVAVERAAERAARAGTGGRFFAGDALGEGLREGYDVLVSTLFLHHLSRDHAVRLLASLAGTARRAVILIDLERRMKGYLAALLGTRFLSTSRVVRTDGPRSVRAAFTRDELAALAAEAGLAGCRTERRWPWRLYLEWRRP